MSCQIGVCADLPAAGSASSPPQIGWNGNYLVGRWTQAVVEFDVPSEGEYQIRAVAPDPDGHRVTFSAPAKALLPGKSQIHGFFKVGRLNPDIEIQVVSVSSGEAVRQWSAPDISALPLASITPETRLILTTGNPSGFDWNGLPSGDGKARESGSSKTDGGVGGITFRAIDIGFKQLPTDPIAYDGVALVVIAGRPVISTEQSAALRDWVVRGGRLFLSLPTESKVARELVQPLADWLPVTVGNDEVTVRNFGKLEYFAGRNVRIPFSGRMTIPGIKIDQGEYLAGGKDEALLVRAPYGLGSVTALALDLTEAPLTKWTEVNSLGRRLAESSSDTETTGRAMKSLQLSSSGVSDFATQVHAVQEDFSDVTRASPWLVMGLMSLLLLVIGPLDYLIVHHVLKSPRGTWVTFPIWIALATLLSANLAVRWNGRSQHINQMNLVNVDVASSTCHQKLWTNLYSPESARRSVTVRSGLKLDTDVSRQAVACSWSGTPESTFGGMLRPSGIYVGRTDYRQTLSGPIEGLPLSQWSSKPILTEVHAGTGKLVEAELVSNSAGKLSGTLTHRFPGPIEDWFLVHGNRVYRQMKVREENKTLPLAASQIWRVDQPNVFQRELRAFLTGEVAISKKMQEGIKSDVVQGHTEYDPLSLNPAEIFRTLTFYNQSGGRAYTTLTNNLLESEDLTHLLRLGRAVLFGRLNVPAAVVEVDGLTVQPNREYTFVRLVLPVRKQGSELPTPLEPLQK